MTWGLAAVFFGFVLLGAYCKRFLRPLDAIVVIIFVPYCGLISSRCTDWLLSNDGTTFASIFDLSGNLVSWGGMWGSILFVLLWMPRRILLAMDIFGPAYFTALGIGRLGCLAEGHDHGKIIQWALPDKFARVFADGLAFDSSGYITYRFVQEMQAARIQIPWYAVSYGPNSRVQFDLVGMPLYPVQALLSIMDFGIAYMCARVWFREMGTGLVAGRALVLWAVGRFTLEFLRGDLSRGADLLVGLSAGQLASIVFGIFGICLLLIGRSKQVSLNAQA